MKNLFKILLVFLFFLNFSSLKSAEKVEYLKTDWSFKGVFGKFDRGALQRGYQVYTEVCASCHSMKYLSYRNLEKRAVQNLVRMRQKLLQLHLKLPMDPIQMVKCLQGLESYLINL